MKVYLNTKFLQKSSRHVEGEIYIRIILKETGIKGNPYIHKAHDNVTLLQYG